MLRSSGRPLEPATRAFFEARFGFDLARVRVHTDGRAADSARAVNAHAYTVGRQIVFADGRYQPGTADGRRLLAHELTHVAQQRVVDGAPPARLPVAAPGGALEQAADRSADAAGGGRGLTGSTAAATSVQRDLATPEPAEPAAAQGDLTAAQIREAINFNAQRYNIANTRLIQDILGGPVTGRWTAANITAIAATQERYGLKKDGKVGADTFEFIQAEQQREGASTGTEDCLTMFNVVVHEPQAGRTAGPNGTTRIRGHHVVEARFSSRCDCSQFEYRQFIAGVATANRTAPGATAVAAQDLAGLFRDLPGRRLPLSMQEDGMRQCAGVNYGHRDQPGQPTTGVNCSENQYRDETGTPDQDRGCVYRAEDFPELTVRNLATGDSVDLLIQFRGEIRRNRTPIQTRRWTTVDSSVDTL